MMATNDDHITDSAAIPEPAAAVVKPEPADEFDPMTWEVPLVCKDCGKDFKVPYRHFQAGVVFHCPHCHGSFVPTTSIYRTVRDAFETFHAARQRSRAVYQRKGRGGNDALARGERRANEDFRRFMDRLAHQMKPAGKLLRRKGFGAMFT